MINYYIREPSKKEISNCINVLYSAFDRDPPEDIKEEERIWNALIDKEIGIYLVAEENGKIFGVGGAFFFSNVCSFGYMAVLQKYRGNGVGTEIFKKLFEIANNRNYRTMFLYASKLGKPIYNKFGFQERFYGMMYQLPMYIPDFGNQNNVVEVLEKFPDWLFSLDEDAIGFNRMRYLNLQVELGAKILVVENEGYGLLIRRRLGPLVSINQNAALQIIKKSIALGANHIIIAAHKVFPKRIIKSMNLKIKGNGSSLKMVCGKELSENLDLLYAIGTYAKG